MPRPPRFIRRALALFRWRARDRDMDREMAFHLESLTHDYLERGLAPEDAAQAARRQFGSVIRLKERGHDVRRSPGLEHLARDVRHAARAVWRSPGFAATVILTLALGIGGNTAIFSVVDQLLLRPLPYPQGEQLLTIYEKLTDADKVQASPANWLDWQRSSRTLLTSAAWRPVSYTLTGAGEPARLSAQTVSAEFFPLLGVAPQLGRTVSESDDRPNAPMVAVLSQQCWEQRFASDPSAIGRIVQFNDQPVEIIGVMPAGFRFIYPDTEAWTAYRLDRHREWRNEGRFIQVVARLRPEATIGSARADLEGIARELASKYAYNKRTGVTLVPLRQELTGQVQSSLKLLYAAVAVLLSIACFNVANLLLARAASRRRELAIRTSLGAGRLAIVRQLLVESVLLAIAGGAFGIALARASLGALTAFAPPDLLRAPQLLVDRRVLLYALGLSLATGLVVGLVPALLVAGRSIEASLRATGSRVTQSPRVRQALVVLQVAMTVILLCGAGVLVRTVVALNRAEIGFDKHGLLTMEVALPAARYTAERRIAFYRDATAALRALPGVRSAAAATSLPVIGSPRAGTPFRRPGTPDIPMNERPFVLIRVVTPGYFRTVGIPILRGREYDDTDLANPMAGWVVNEAFVKAHLAGVDPIGASMAVIMEPTNPQLPIIGVAGDVSEESVNGHARPTVFFNHRRLPEGTMTLFVRGDHPDTLAKPAVSAMHAIDPDLPVTKIRTFERALADNLARERLNAIVSGAFALSGLLLSALGLYGLLAFLVSERTKEIGIRIALGAHLGRLTRSVIGSGLWLVAIGAAIGVSGSLVLLRSFGALLFGVTPYSWSTYAAVLALLGVVATFAAYLPARRAARVEPLVALRQE